MKAIQITIASLFFFPVLLGILGFFKTQDLSDTHIKRSLQLLLISSSGWSFLQIAQLLSSSVTISHTLQLFGLMIGLTTVPAWLYFVSAFTGRNYHNSSYFKVGVILSLSIIFVFKATNPIHGWYFTVETIVTPFEGTQFKYHIMHHIMTFVSYGLILVGFMFLYKDRESLPITETKLYLSTGILLIPAVVSILSTFNIYDFLGSVSYDPLGVSFFALTILLFTGSSRNQLHMSRHNTFFDGLEEPVVIIDKESNEITDFNSSAQEDPFNFSNDDLEKIISQKINKFSLGDDILQIEDFAYSIVVSEYSSKKNRDSYSILFKDVTTLENQKELLELKNTHFKDMMEGLSHEFRNGLQIIQGYSSFDPVTQEHVEVIDNTTERLYRVNEDLTALAKIGKNTNSVGQILFEKEMESVINENEVEDININYKGSGHIFVDRSIFKLLVNKVVKFSKETDSENVEFELSDGNLLISNDGAGIESCRPESAFEYGESVPSAELGSILPVIKSIFNNQSWEFKLLEHEDGLEFVIKGVTDPQSVRIE